MKEEYDPLTDDLIGRLRTRQVANWIHSPGESPHSIGFKPDADCIEAADALQDQADELIRLRAEVEIHRISVHSCHDNCTRAGCVNGRLRAENEALRVDAERYRWLRASDDDRYETYKENMLERLDEAIDAAKGTP